MNSGKIGILDCLFGGARQPIWIVKLGVALLGAMLFCAPGYTHAKVCEAELEQAVRAWEAWGSSTETITASRKRIGDRSFALSSLECAVALPASLAGTRQKVEKLAQETQASRSGPEVIFRMNAYFLADGQLDLCVLLEREAQCSSQKNSLTESDAQKIHTKLVENDQKIKADLEKHCENPLRFWCELTVRDTQRLATEVNTYNSNPELVRLAGKLEVESPGIAAPLARRQQTATSAEKLAAMASSGSSSSGALSSSMGSTGTTEMVPLSPPGNAKSRNECLKLEWITSPLSKELDGSGGTLTDPKHFGDGYFKNERHLVMYKTCEEDLVIAAFSCEEDSMPTSGHNYMGSWVAGEHAATGFRVFVRRGIKTGVRWDMAPEYDMGSKGSTFGGRRKRVMKVFYGAWLRSDLMKEGGPWDDTSYNRKVDALIRKTKEVLGVPSNSSPEGQSWSPDNGGKNPGVKTCAAFTAAEVWNATR